MTYTQSVIDNFNDASINTSIWTINTGTGLSESGGTLNLACVSQYPEIAETNGTFNIEDGILAVKVSKSGTPTAESEIYMSIQDDNGKFIGIWFGALGAITVQTYGAIGVSDPVITDTGGFGSGWVNGTWFGIGNLGVSDNILRFYKSSDGQNWTEMVRVTITSGSPFVRTTTGLLFNAGVWGGGSSTLVWQLDDASRFTFVAGGSDPKVKIRSAGAWVEATPKVRQGGAWVTATPKARVAGVWTETS